jgi:hypothetical protein
VQRVPDGRQEDVAARLVGLRLEGEAQLVALRDDVVAQHVDRLAVAVERVARVLGDGRLGALAPAPEDVDLRAELDAEVDRAHRLADRRAADAAVVGGERAVLEGGMAEQVRRGHPDAQARLVQRRPEPRHDPVALGRRRAPRHEVVVVEADAPRAELGEPAHGLDGVQGRARRPAERVAAGIAHGPQSEGELVLRSRSQDVVGSGHGDPPCTALMAGYSAR